LPNLFKSSNHLSLRVEGYLTEGFQFNKGGKEKILLIHGFESSVVNFIDYVQSLIEKDFEVVAFNAKAHGNSEGTTVTIPEYLKQLEQIELTYGPFHGFMGHSFGGLALAHLLEKIKDNPHRKAVFIAPATETTTAIDGFFRLLHLNEGIKEAFYQLILEKGGVEASYYSIRRAATNIQARVLWLHDENDRITPLDDAKKVMEDGHPNFSFMITQGLGHKKIYRDVNVQKRILSFFEED
jgi:pimeloyl-ACP methyl ester carboxylesterase